MRWIFAKWHHGCRPNDEILASGSSQIPSYSCEGTTKPTDNPLSFLAWDCMDGASECWVFKQLAEDSTREHLLEVLSLVGHCGLGSITARHCYFTSPHLLTSPVKVVAPARNALTLEVISFWISTVRSHVRFTCSSSCTFLFLQGAGSP